MKIRYITKFLFTILLTLSSVLWAEETSHVSLNNLPQYYPSYFQHSAILTGIDKKNSEMIFGALHVKYDTNIQVHLLSTEFGTVDQLEPGMSVAFSVYDALNKKGSIKQLWQLPAGSVSSH